MKNYNHIIEEQWDEGGRRWLLDSFEGWMGSR